VSKKAAKLMRQVLTRAAYLFRRPGVIFVTALLGAGGAALVMLPLFGVPGYELGLAMALGVGIFGGVVGIASALEERRTIQGRDWRLVRAVRRDTAGSSVWVAVAAAAAINVLTLVPPLIAAFIYSLTNSRCNPLANLGFYPLLALPSALVAATTGVLCGFACKRALHAGGLYLALLLASAAWTAWPVIFGPQVYAYNHFGGYLPGPLYDEALELRPALLWFRLQTMLLAGFLCAGTTVLLNTERGFIGRARWRPAALALLFLFGAGVFGIEAGAPALGLRIGEQQLALRLGGFRESPHFRIFYPRAKAKAELDRLIRDMEFRYSQIQSFLGGAPSQPIRVYLYGSAEEKKSLIGAGGTQFAKPWRLEIHLNDSPFPSAGLKHELAHAMAAPFGSGPFRVTSRFKIWPNMGIVEGLAVAADNPVDELTLHQWAAAMRQQKLAPDVRALFRFQAFYGSAAQRAYTVAGSFIRYLGETYGSEKLRGLYQRGDFVGTYGQSLDALAREWEKFLDSVPLDPAAVHQAFARFRRASIFARPCAREVAQLQSAAADLLYSNPAQALPLYARCAEIQPDEPSFLLGQAKALEKLEREDDAERLLNRLAEKVHGHPALEAQAEMELADLEFRRGRVERAGEHLQKTLELQPAPALDRAARIKLAALRSRLGTAIWAYFGEEPEELRLVRLREALDQDPEDPYATYLFGRKLKQLGAPPLALRYLSRSLAAELPQSIRGEALRVKVEAEYLDGDCAGVRNELGHLPDFGEAYKANVGEWAERCQFEEQAFHGPLVSKEPFR
jgi:tetratricopeptide (TPR) repeat protein